VTTQSQVTPALLRKEEETLSTPADSPPRPDPPMADSRIPLSAVGQPPCASSTKTSRVSLEESRDLDHEINNLLVPGMKICVGVTPQPTKQATVPMQQQAPAISAMAT